MLFDRRRGENFSMDENNSVLDIYEKTGYFIFLFVGITILITSTLLLGNITVGIYNLLAGYFITWISVYYIFYRKRYKKFILVGILATCVIIVAVVLNTYIQEIAYDGNLYHKFAVGLLKIGWNPIYDNIYEYIKILGIPDNRISSSDIWVACYPKAAWYFDSSIYALTNNIESAKVFNFLILYGTLAINYHFFSKKLRTTLAIIISLAMVMIPAGCSQIFTFYVDGALGALLVTSAIILISLSEEQDLNKRKIDFLCLAICIVVCSNLKITGLAFEAILCGVFFVYWCILIKKKCWDNKGRIYKWLIYYTLVVIITVGIVGFGTYICNIRDFGNPLYPMFGSDILNVNNSLKNVDLDKSSPLIQILSMIFVRTSNSDNIPTLEWKIPFTFEISEFYKCGQDTIRGGAGVLFSGILCVSLIMLLYFILNEYKNIKKEYIPVFLVITYAFIMLCIMPAGGQTRYSPYIYYIPYFTLYIWMRDIELNVSLHKQSSRKYKAEMLIGIVMTVLIFINASAFFEYSIRGIIESRKYQEQYEKMKATKIVLIDTPLPGLVFNFIDQNITYEYQTNVELKDGKMEYLFLTYQLYK